MIYVRYYHIRPTYSLMASYIQYKYSVSRHTYTIRLGRYDASRVKTGWSFWAKESRNGVALYCAPVGRAGRPDRRRQASGPCWSVLSTVSEYCKSIQEKIEENQNRRTTWKLWIAPDRCVKRVWGRAGVKGWLLFDFISLFWLLFRFSSWCSFGSEHWKIAWSLHILQRATGVTNRPTCGYGVLLQRRRGSRILTLATGD